MSRFGKKTGQRQCANPVFEQWIMDWKEDAVARDLQSKHTYTKCLNSLRKYPMYLNSGKEAIILEGFGDKICKLIDEKLKEFLDEGGVLHEEVLLDSSSDQEISDDEITLISSVTETTSQGSEVLAGPSTTELIDKHKSRTFAFGASSKSSSVSSKVSEKTSDSATTKKPSRGTRKEYIPEPRSGPYALLVTLFNNETEMGPSTDDQVAFMLKADLCQAAQDNCNSQFVSTDPSNHYTAWSSMSGLIKRNLIEKSKNLPAQYSLTVEGRKLASKLLFGETDQASDSTDSEETVKKAQKTSNSFSRANSSTDQLDLRVSPRISQQPEANRPIEIGSESDDGIITIAEINKPSEVVTEVKKKNLGARTYHSVDLSSDEELPDIDVAETNTNYNDYRVSNPLQNITNSKKPNAEKRKDKKVKSSVAVEKPVTVEDTCDLQPVKNSIEKPTSSLTSSSAGFNATNFVKKNSSLGSQLQQEANCMFSFQPGTYDIYLFVDNCEQTAKKQDILIDELKKSKIKFDIGKLNVSDFTWIARPKSANGASDKDLILNCVLERKRMDDFCSSIIDGRYKEQKFRLKKCGITKKIYLIEEHGSIKHMSLPEKSLVQADVNTQIIDHLIVHRTTDPKDTAHYLIEMTNYLTKAFQNLTLNACSKEDLDRFNDQDRERTLVQTYCMTLKEFNAFSNKNKPLTMKEMFAKCMMKIQGMSQEKCLAIVDVFPTMESLMKEYAKCPENKREKLLANVKYGSQQRNIGPAISKLVAQLFCSQGLV